MTTKGPGMQFHRLVKGAPIGGGAGKFLAATIKELAGG